LDKQHIHIVSLDVPFPADYGGAIDIFYRIKALYTLGFVITLHVFEYGRGKQIELDKYAKVIYYKRNKSIFQLFSTRPFIVQTRISNELLANLLVDNDPILFEGLHTCWYLENEKIQQRMTFVRMHNLEHKYYQGLKRNASFVKKFYFHQEAIKLKKYQKVLSNAKYILAIKEDEQNELLAFNSNVMVLPASFPETEGSYAKVQRYALFHGNLSVPENEVAAAWIIKTLKSISDSSFELLIAGKNPSKRLIQLCKKEQIELHANPTKSEMDSLIQEAQIHVLYSTVPSGIKLKLLACLHSSGHILVNEKMKIGKALEQFCVVAADSKAYKMHFLGLLNGSLKEEEYKERERFIEENFNNITNCRIIQKLIQDA